MKEMTMQMSNLMKIKIIRLVSLASKMIKSLRNHKLILKNR